MTVGLCKASNPLGNLSFFLIHVLSLDPPRSFSLFSENVLELCPPSSLSLGFCSFLIFFPMGSTSHLSPVYYPTQLCFWINQTTQTVHFPFLSHFLRAFLKLYSGLWPRVLPISSLFASPRVELWEAFINDDNVVGWCLHWHTHQPNSPCSPHSPHIRAPTSPAWCCGCHHQRRHSNRFRLPSRTRPDCYQPGPWPEPGTWTWARMGSGERGFWGKC